MKNGKISSGTFPLKRSRSFGLIALIVGLFVAVFALWSVFAIKSDLSRRNISKLYAEAFVLYDDIDFSSPYTPSQDLSLRMTIDMMQRVVDAHHRFSEWYIANAQIGFIYIYQEKPQEAIPYLEKLQGAPLSTLGREKALVALARIYSNRKEVDKAVKIYRELETKAKGELLNFVRYQLGIIYSAQKESASLALSVYEKISQDSPLRPLADRDMIVLKSATQSS